MTQKELKAKFEEILRRDVWPNNPRMVAWSVKQAARIVELENGDFVSIDKPSIKKDFCFGYSDSRFDTADYDRANDMIHHASTSEDHFFEKNLAEINKTIEQLENQKVGRQEAWCEYRIFTRYSGQPADSPYKGLSAFDKYDNRYSEFAPPSTADLAQIIEGYKIVKVQFEKRLHTYLRRYGLSKVNAWSYWQDA